MNISKKILIYFVLMATLLLITFINLTRVFKDARLAEEIQTQRYEFYQLVNTHKENTTIFTNIFTVYVSRANKEYERKIQKVLKDKKFDVKKISNKPEIAMTIT